MKGLRRTAVGVALGAMLAMPAASALAAQEGTPPGQPAAGSVSTRVALAASTLTASDLPADFAFVGETFLTAEQLAGGVIDPAALTSAGFETQYVSVYENRSQNLRVRSYVSAWTDAAAAEAGFAILEDEATFSPGAALTDGGAGVGEAPGETTTGTYTAEDGATISTVDITFRRGNLIAGVALEKLDGSEVDAAVATQLAERLDGRVQQLQAGESPAGTDLVLPGQALSPASLGETIQVGYLGAPEVERIYGLQGSVLDSVQASWVESVALANGPTMTVGLTTFASEEDAASAVEMADQLALPLANQEEVPDVALDGADAVRAFRFTSPASEAGAIDSYRIVYAVGSTLTVVDVQGAASDVIAAESATTLAQTQLGCQGGGSCELPALPAELTGA